MRSSGTRSPLPAGDPQTGGILLQFKRLFEERPELTRDLAAARDLGAAAELLADLGARNGIATNAAEIRAYIRRMQKDYAPQKELSSDQLDGIAAGAGGDVATMLDWLGLGAAEQAPDVR